MRLRTLESYFLIKNGLLSTYPSLQSDQKCELLVVGGGITGALVSYSLVQNGYDVILIDKRDIAMGSTSANTGILQYEVDMPLYQLSTLLGEDTAATCYKAGINAIKDLKDLVHLNSIDCDYMDKGSLYVAKTKEDSVWLYEEFKIREKHGLGVQWLSDKTVYELYGVNCFGAILSETAGGLDSYKLTHALIKISVEKGMRVFDQTHADKFEFNNDKIIIQTQSGHTIMSDKIIFCTGYEATNLIKENICKLHYTYSCISEQSANYNPALDSIVTWDTGLPYFYMRTSNDKRILIGGEDIDFNVTIFQNSIKKFRTKHLMDRLENLIPGTPYIDDFSWGGTFASTKDSLPYIGASPEFKNAYFVLGYGGNGITFSVQAMSIINDLLKDRKNELAHWYRFGR
jgi:glycine/D-amino acid oxidase-like deaminating enzyme